MGQSNLPVNTRQTRPACVWGRWHRSRLRMPCHRSALRRAVPDAGCVVTSRGHCGSRGRAGTGRRSADQWHGVWSSSQRGTARASRPGPPAGCYYSFLKTGSGLVGGNDTGRPFGPDPQRRGGACPGLGRSEPCPAPTGRADMPGRSLPTSARWFCNTPESPRHLRKWTRHSRKSRLHSRECPRHPRECPRHFRD